MHNCSIYSKISHLLNPHGPQVVIMYKVSFEVGTALPLPVHYSKQTATALSIEVQQILIETQLVQCVAPSEASTRLAAECQTRQKYFQS